MRAESHRTSGIITAIGVAVLAVLPNFLLGTLAIDIRSDLRFSSSTLGLLSGLFFLSAAASSLVLGHAADFLRFGRALLVSAIGSIIVFTAIGASPTLWFLGGTMVMGGLVEAFAQPASNLAVAKIAPSTRLGLVYGLKLAAIPTAALMAGLAVPLVAPYIGWRWVFGLGAALAAIVAVLSAPLESGKLSNRHRPQKLDHVSLVVVLTVVAALGAAAAQGTIVFMVSALSDLAVMNAGQAGFLLSAASLINVLTRVIGGWLMDGRSNSAPLVAMAIIFLLGSTGFFLLATTGGGWVILGALLALGIGWGWSSLLVISVIRLNPGAPAAATGASQTGILTGCVIGPSVFGLLAERVSFAASWIWAGSLELVAFCLLVMVLMRGRRLSQRT